MNKEEDQVLSQLGAIYNLAAHGMMYLSEGEKGNVKIALNGILEAADALLAALERPQTQQGEALTAVMGLETDARMANAAIDRESAYRCGFNEAKLAAISALTAPHQGTEHPVGSADPVAVGFSRMELAPIDGTAVLLHMPTTTDKFAIGQWHGDAWGDDEGNYYVHEPVGWISLRVLERLAATPSRAPADDYKEPEAVATLTAEGWVWDGDQWVLPRAPASVQDEPWTKRDGETNAMYLERQARIAGESK